MEVLYVCGTCDRMHRTETDAYACEAHHKEAEARRKLLAEQKESRWEEVKKLKADYMAKLTAYLDDYLGKV